MVSSNSLTKPSNSIESDSDEFELVDDRTSVRQNAVPSCLSVLQFLQNEVKEISKAKPASKILKTKGSNFSRLKIN
jgi:paraquat-inducible protein B